MSRLAHALRLALLLTALGPATSACEPGHGVTFRNQTNQRLTVYQYGRYAFTLEPSQKTTASIFKFTGTMPIEAKDDNGNVLYSESVSWQQLKEMNWEVVITGIPTVPAPGPSP